MKKEEAENGSEKENLLIQIGNIYSFYELNCFKHSHYLLQTQSKSVSKRLTKTSIPACFYFSIFLLKK